MFMSLNVAVNTEKNGSQEQFVTPVTMTTSEFSKLPLRTRKKVDSEIGLQESSVINGSQRPTADCVRTNYSFENLHSLSEALPKNCVHPSKDIQISFSEKCSQFNSQVLAKLRRIAITQKMKQNLSSQQYNPISYTQKENSRICDLSRSSKQDMGERNTNQAKTTAKYMHSYANQAKTTEKYMHSDANQAKTTAKYMQSDANQAKTTAKYMHTDANVCNVRKIDVLERSLCVRSSCGQQTSSGVCVSWSDSQNKHSSNIVCKCYLQLNDAISGCVCDAVNTCLQKETNRTHKNTMGYHNIRDKKSVFKEISCPQSNNRCDVRRQNNTDLDIKTENSWEDQSSTISCSQSCVFSHDKDNSDFSDKSSSDSREVLPEVTQRSNISNSNILTEGCDFNEISVEPCKCQHEEIFNANKLEYSDSAYATSYSGSQQIYVNTSDISQLSKSTYEGKQLPELNKHSTSMGSNMSTRGAEMLLGEKVDHGQDSTHSQLNESFSKNIRNSVGGFGECDSQKFGCSVQEKADKEGAVIMSRGLPFSQKEGRYSAYPTCHLNRNNSSPVITGSVEKCPVIKYSSNRYQDASPPLSNMNQRVAIGNTPTSSTNRSNQWIIYRENNITDYLGSKYGGKLNVWTQKNAHDNIQAVGKDNFPGEFVNVLEDVENMDDRKDMRKFLKLRHFGNRSIPNVGVEESSQEDNVQKTTNSSRKVSNVTCQISNTDILQDSTKTIQESKTINLDLGIHGISQTESTYNLSWKHYEIDKHISKCKNGDDILRKYTIKLPVTNITTTIRSSRDSHPTISEKKIGNSLSYRSSLRPQNQHHEPSALLAEPFKETNGTKDSCIGLSSQNITLSKTCRSEDNSQGVLYSNSMRTKNTEACPDQPTSDLLDYFWSYQGMGRQILGIESTDKILQKGNELHKYSTVNKITSLPPLKRQIQTDYISIPKLKHRNDFIKSRLQLIVWLPHADEDDE